MARLPVISGKELVRVLLQNGFAQVRQAGSHVLVEHSDGRITTIPVHGNKDMPKGTLRRMQNSFNAYYQSFFDLLSLVLAVSFHVEY